MRFQCCYRLIVWHSARSSVLIRRVDDKYELPRVEFSNSHDWPDVGVIIQAAREQLSLQIVVIRCLKASYSAVDHWPPEHPAADDSWTGAAGALWLGTRRLRRTIAGVSVTGTFVVQPEWECRVSGNGLSWIEMGGTDQLMLDWSDRQSVEQWRACLMDRSAEPQVPWYQPDWFLTERLELIRTCGNRDVRPAVVEQVRWRARAAVVRVVTRSNTVYAKAVPPGLPNEQAVLNQLSALGMNSMPKVEWVKGVWTGTREILGQSLARSADVQDWVNAASAVAEAQVALSRDVGSLIKAGLPVFDNQHILTVATEIAWDESFDRNCVWVLSNDERRLFVDSLDDIATMLATLANSAIPLSVDHVDLWPSNVFTLDGKCNVFDWADSVVSHPFFSTDVLLDEAEDRIGRESGVRDQMTRAYLAHWTVFAEPEVLSELYTIASCLAPLRSAVYYYSVVRRHIGMTWENRNMVPFYVVKFLNAMGKH
jgi:hypothetical protein